MKLASQIAVLLALTIGVAACGDSTDPDEDAPHTTELAISTAPELPSGLTILCPIDGTATVSGPTCPVVIWNGVTYWPLNFVDGRNSIKLVGFNADKDPVIELDEEVGVRNIWQITINETQETVILRGQGDATVTIPWSDLPPP